MPLAQDSDVLNNLLEADHSCEEPGAIVPAAGFALMDERVEVPVHRLLCDQLLIVEHVASAPKTLMLLGIRTSAAAIPAK